MSDNDEMTDLVQGMATAIDTLTVVLEAVAGYRDRCVSMDFSTDAAEQMAVDLHRMMLSQMGAAKETS